MSGMQSSDDLIPSLEHARDLKVEDRIPLFFLDEFDSDPKNTAFLLPLLWDGEVNIGQRDLKLGRIIVVLAGSDPKLPETMEEARSMRKDVRTDSGTSAKTVDLLSRINGGVFGIPAFVDNSKKINRRPDKVCIAIQLLRHRFGAQLHGVPLSFLRFVANTEFRYGVRSIAHLIDSIPHKKDIQVLHVADLKLKLDSPQAVKTSSLAYHILHEDQALGVANAWKDMSRDDKIVPVWSTWLDNVPRHVPDDILVSYLLRRLIYEVRSLKQEKTGAKAIQIPQRTRKKTSNKGMVRDAASRGGRRAAHT